MSPTDPELRTHHTRTKAVDPYPVRCINNKWAFNAPIHITEGKGYMVVGHSLDDKMVQVYNDIHLPCLYVRERFEAFPLCKYCGGVIGQHFHSSLNKTLMENVECYSCNFWREILEQMKTDPDFYVVEGSVYHDAKQVVIGTKGFGGHRWYIRTNDGRYVTTDNLWHRGDVPVAWKDKFPDNAGFMDREEWNANRSG